MSKRAVSGIMLTLLLLGMLRLAFDSQPAKAEPVVLGIELKYQTPYLLPEGLIYVLVETPVFDGIEASLRQYATDLESIDGFSVGIYTVSTSNTTAIRSFLQQALPEGLVGCLLVGDMPGAYYEWYDYQGRHKDPTDFYYMDLDGLWSDTDGNGVYDKHGGDIGAEIWVGSLQPSLVSGDDIWLLNNYFKKNHLYRTGKLTLPKRALVYIDDDYAGDGEFWTNTIKIAYDEIFLVNDTEITTALDYKNRLGEGYEWIYLCCHGSPGRHVFKHHGYWDGIVYGLDYRTIDPLTFFYVFSVCGGASGYNGIVNSVLFTDTYGLLAFGCQQAAGPGKGGFYIQFYEALSQGKYIGEAYLEDVKYTELWNAPENEYYWKIGGDPSLHIKGYPDIAPPVVTILSPQSATYTTNSVPLTFTVDEAASWIGYSLDGQANITITGNSTLTGLSEGTHYISVYANDTIGNMGASDTVYFTIALPYGPKAEFTAIPETALTSESIRFDASSSLYGWNGTHEISIAEYRWDFGDGNKTTTSTPIVYHKFSSSGIYYVALTVYAPGATPETDTATHKVTVISVPVGGYSIPIQTYSTAKPLTPYLILTAILTIAFTTIKRKTTKKIKQSPWQSHTQKYQ